MSDIPLEHFRPFVPNSATKLGQAYLYAIKDLDGVLLATEANFLRGNPLLWLRGLTLYASNTDFLIRQAKTRVKAMAPIPGEELTSEYLGHVRQHKAWSIIQEHRLQKVRSRRAELVIELGYSDIRQALVVGDVVEGLTEILTAVQQEDWREVEGLARHWIKRLTGLGNTEEEPSGQPEVPVAREMTEAEALAVLMSHIRGEGRS